MFERLAELEKRLSRWEIGKARLVEARLRKALRRWRPGQRERRRIRVRALGMNLF